MTYNGMNGKGMLHKRGGAGATRTAWRHRFETTGAQPWAWRQRRGRRRIGGLSTVRRCVKNTVAEDIGLHSCDVLCLDGEPLVLTSGTHMVACVEYRTSRERFVRVWAKIASGNLWFEAMAPMIFQRVVYDAMLGHMR